MKIYEFTVVVERDEDGRFVAVEDRLDRGEPIHEEVGSSRVAGLTIEDLT